MLSMRRLGLSPVSRGAEVGAALSCLLPYYGVCGLAVLRAALRRRRQRADREFRHVSLLIDRTAGRADQRPLAG